MTDKSDQGLLRSVPPDERVKQLQAFIDRLPHSRALGMRVRHIGAGEVVMDMPYDSRLIGDPQTRVIFGGALSAVMDTCCGAATMSHPSNPKSMATLCLRIDYMRTARPDQSIRTWAKCYHATRSVAFVRGAALDDEDDTNPVAMAAGTFVVAYA